MTEMGLDHSMIMDEDNIALSVENSPTLHCEAALGNNDNKLDLCTSPVDTLLCTQEVVTAFNQPEQDHIEEGTDVTGQVATIENTGEIHLETTTEESPDSGGLPFDTKTHIGGLPFDTKTHILSTPSVSEAEIVIDNSVHSPITDVLKLSDEKYSSAADVRTFSGTPVLQNIIETHQPVDTIISCSDGKVGAHRIVLTAASEFLGQLFKGQRLGEMAVLVLPDISRATVESLLHLAYTGQMIYTQTDEEKVYDALQCLLFGEWATWSLRKVVTQSPSLNPSEELSKAESTSVTPDISKNNANQNNEDAVLNDVNTPSSSSTCDSAHVNESIQCSICKKQFANKYSLARHEITQHGVGSYRKPSTATLDEIKLLSLCTICNVQYKTVARAQFCYNQHHYSRCWICLEIYPSTHSRDHLQAVHGENIDGQVFVRCRWCSVPININNTHSGLANHCTRVHLTLNNSSTNFPIAPGDSSQSFKKSKKRARKNSENQSYFSGDIDSTVTSANYRKSTQNGQKLQTARRTGRPVGRSKGISFKEAALHVTGVLTNSINLKPKAEKVTIDVKNLPEVSVLLEHMEMDAYFRKKFKFSLPEDTVEPVDIDVKLHLQIENSNNSVPNFYSNEPEPIRDSEIHDICTNGTSDNSDQSEILKEISSEACNPDINGSSTVTLPCASSSIPASDVSVSEFQCEEASTEPSAIKANGFSEKPDNENFIINTCEKSNDSERTVTATSPNLDDEISPEFFYNRFQDFRRHLKLEQENLNLAQLGNGDFQPDSGDLEMYRMRDNIFPYDQYDLEPVDSSFEPCHTESDFNCNTE